jgi:hypothetical protein
MSEHYSVNLDEIIARVPGWGAAEDIKVRLIGGLTNTNYQIETIKPKSVLRKSGGNTTLLGINGSMNRKPAGRCCT